MTAEDLMQDPEYKAYLDAHPTEWIDDFIRNRLMRGEEVLMPSEGIYLWPRIKERFNEKFYDWLKEDYGCDKDEFDSKCVTSIQWESIPPKRDPLTGKEYRDGASWMFSMKVERKKDVFD